MTSKSSVITLWDPARRSIYEQRSRGEASGTTNLPAMGITDLPTSVRANTMMRLKS